MFRLLASPCLVGLEIGFDLSFPLKAVKPYKIGILGEPSTVVA